MAWLGSLSLFGWQALPCSASEEPSLRTEVPASVTLTAPTLGSYGIHVSTKWHTAHKLRVSLVNRSKVETIHLPTSIDDKTRN